MVVPLLRLSFGEHEEQATLAVLRSGMLVQGPEVAAFEAAVRDRLGRAHAVAVANGTAALELALAALGLGPGDDVLCPNLTWPSPAHAIQRVGARPVLVDVDAAEWNAAPDAYVAARTPRTRAAIAIDQFGVPARVPEIAAALPGVTVVEDAACAIGSVTAAGPCGTFGAIACLSFHPRKVLTTGEGGMCLTDDGTLAERLRTLRNHGQRTPGEFVATGGNHRLPELAAALGRAQLPRLDAFIAARTEQAERYRAALPALTFQATPAGARANHQTLGAILPEGIERARFLAQLAERGVQAGILSYALDRLPEFAASRAEAVERGRSFPVSHRLVDRGVALPCFPGLSDMEHSAVVDAVKRALGA